MMRVPHHLFEMIMVLHIKTLLVTQRKQQRATQLLVVFCTRATQRGKRQAIVCHHLLPHNAKFNSFLKTNKRG